MNATSAGVPIERLDVAAYLIPTDEPESDGTFEWSSTTLVLVEIAAGGATGIGYSYADRSTATLIADKFKPLLAGYNAMAIPECWDAMVGAIRNLGRPGIAAMAVSAVDNALWDLKGRLLSLPVVTLLGAARDAVPIYGSGGFTSYSNDELQRQFSSWASQGINRVKMKIGREPEHDLARIKTARDAIGTDVQLFVDANGAYSRKQALAMAEQMTQYDVRWFEEPVPSDDLEGLCLLRDRAPAPIDISAGEYGYDALYFRRMLQAGAVDVLQADATRCAGITGFMRAAALCEAFSLPLSSHCAPSIHVHACCAATPVRHLEYFHDHVRIEGLLFDGACVPISGMLKPDTSHPGLGIDFKHADAQRYRI